ncbi:MAG: hypothetical protein JSS30_03950 [Verrucomicrobia bacterium]|nr:hypothetical protein [Verrucomicrobiota bacterium]
MMTRLVLVLILIFSIGYSNTTLKSRLIRGTPGDYIVTAQGENYSLLLLRSIDSNRLILEEISIEQENVDLKKINWKNWVENKAPRAISWTALVFDLEKNSLAQCYSFLEKQWVFIDESDYFVKELFTLTLRPTRDTERKRIGPPPEGGEIDRRKMWCPQFIFNGVKQKKTDFEVLRAKWPNDKTRLAGCILELYLDPEQPNFPFPYWMEVQHPHYTFKVSTIDSGSGINSPMPLLK